MVKANVSLYCIFFGTLFVIIVGRLYQGMTTGNSINPDNNNKFQEGLPEQIPYFGRGNTSTGLWSHIHSHLHLKPRDTTTNPYLDADTGFHITFYEIREGEHLGLNEVWKHGPLYDHPEGWHFRKSAYTVRFQDGTFKGYRLELTAPALHSYWRRHTCG